MATTSNNDDFIRINDEYVKFYATTNSALPNILKNTGALIVVQDNNSIDELNDHIRSIYIAKNFVAEGHGFSAYTVRDYYDELATYDGDYRRLDKKLNNIDERITDNTNKFQDYVEIKGGDISITKIDRYNDIDPKVDSKIHSYVLTYLLKPAEYKDAFIDNVFSYVTYTTYVHGENNQQFISYATNIDELDFNDHNITRNIRYNVPRGSILTSAYLYFESNNNDTVGFDNITDVTDLQYKSVISKYEYNLDLTDSVGTFLMNDDNCADVSSATMFEVHNKGSQENKSYPWIDKSKVSVDSNVTSVENKIHEYTLNVGYITPVICDVIRYNFVTSGKQLSYTEISKYHSMITDNHNGTYTCNINECINNTYAYISVPINYQLTHVHLINQYDKNNHKSYYEYNVTGDVYELIQNNKSQLSYYNVPNNNYIIKCKNYILMNKLTSTSRISLTLSYVDNIKYDDKNYSDLLNEKFITSSYFLQDSEYNSTHWINPNDLSYVIDYMQ